MSPSPAPTPDDAQDVPERRPWEPPALTVLTVSERTKSGTAPFTDEFNPYPSSSTYIPTS